MSTLSTADKLYLENALRLDSNNGIVRFAGDEFNKFFEELGINIDDEKYCINGSSKLEKMRMFWKLENNKTVARVILELAAWFRNRELLGLNVKFSTDIEKIGNKLLQFADNDNSLPKNHIVENYTQDISLSLDSDIFNHIKNYLNSGDYFHAIEESYKMVRNKLKEITGHEKASDVFNPNAENKSYWKDIFGDEPNNDNPEYDFCRGVGYLNLAIQFLRNEKSHILAQDIDKNSALHYITLASLTYKLISRES